MERTVIRFDFLHDARPDAFESIRRLRLARRWHNVLAAFATVLVCLTVAAAVENVRLSEARADEARAQARVDRTRDELNRLEVAWRKLDELVARDRKLRAIRTSGPACAARLAELGNLLTDGAWLTAMTTEASRYTLKGRARGMREFASVLAGVVADGGLQRPARVSVSRERRSALSGVDFEIDAGSAR